MREGPEEAEEDVVRKKAWPLRSSTREVVQLRARWRMRRYARVEEEEAVVMRVSM